MSDGNNHDEVMTVTVTDRDLGVQNKRRVRVFTIAGVTYEGEDRTVEFEGGRFEADSPAGAAKKAANKVFRKLLQSNHTTRTLDIVVRETTKPDNTESKRRTKTGEEYVYRATKDPLGENERRVVIFLKGLWEADETAQVSECLPQLETDREYKVGDIMRYSPKPDQPEQVYRCIRDHKPQKIPFGVDIKLESLRVKGGRKRPRTQTEAPPTES